MGADQAAVTQCQGLGTSVSSAFGTTVFDYQQMFDVLAVFFWKPVPYSGYQCLGHISSNGQGNMPVTELDVNQEYSGLGTSLNPSAELEAMYCVQQKYVVEGRIGDLLMQSADKTVAIFEVRAKDSTGFDNGHLFYAQPCPSGVLADCPVTEKVYVLNSANVLDIGVEGSSSGD